MIAATAKPTPAAATDRSYRPPEMTEVLSDGAEIRIRPLRASDAALELGFLEDLSTTSIHQRFLASIVPDAALARQLTEIDGVQRMAFGAFCYAGGTPRLVGVSRYARESDPGSCECAITVADDWQERGLGTILLRYLVEHARNHGLHQMRSLDSTSNLAMRGLAADFGFARSADPDDATTVIHTLQLP